MFEKTLTDLIRGIRAHKKDEQRYIASCLQEIHQEVKSNDPDIKAMAISKLTYLQMFGYDMSWVSFHVVEVMSFPKFSHKRTGYLAATQSFRQDTDVLMLTTNLLKKDLASGNHMEVGVALNGLADIVTPDLARDLCQDLVAMLNHSRPYVRKKVVLALYKLFLKFPEALRLSFPRLKEKLDDPDPSVVSAAVNVICELARKNPKNYLSLAPQLFNLLTNSSNNWMLIKIIKLFGALAPLEPRLAKKLTPQIFHMIENTPAMSLLYECIYTAITGGMLNSDRQSDALAAVCVSKLRTFLESVDQNLKYVGLLALAKILPTHPKHVAEHRDIILKCIDDSDISIRLRSLDLVVGMVNKKNLTDIVKRLMSHLLPPSNTKNSATNHLLPSTLLEPAYRADIIHRIIYICSQNSYANVTNFEWYVAVLVDLTYVAGVKVGDLLTSQLMDVCVRVKSVRNYCVKAMIKLLSDVTLLENCSLPDSNAEVLYAAAWLAGEYCSYQVNPSDTIEHLLQSGVTKLSHRVQAVYVHNVLKIYAYWAKSHTYNWDEDAKEDLLRVTTLIDEKFGMFCSCTDLEVQERAHNVRAIISIVREQLTSNVPVQTDKTDNYDLSETAPAVIDELYNLFFAYELNPVAPKAQKKVPIPAGLDLDAWINEPPPPSESNSSGEEESYGFGYRQRLGGSGDLVFSKSSGTAVGRRRGRKNRQKGDRDKEESEEMKDQRRRERRERMRNDPFYIDVGDYDTPKRTKPESPPKSATNEVDVDSIPVVRLTMDDFDFRPKKNKGKSKRSKESRRREISALSSLPPVIYTDIGEMPENATLSDDDRDVKPQDQEVSPWRKPNDRGILDIDFSGISNVDLSTPLTENEKFPQTTVYLSPEELRKREEERNRLRLKEQRNKSAITSDRSTKVKDDDAKSESKKRRSKVKSKKPSNASESSAVTAKKKSTSAKKTKGEVDAGERVKPSAGKARKEKENKGIKNKKGVKEKKKKTAENKTKSVSFASPGIENGGSHVNQQSVQPVKQNNYTLISGDTLYITYTLSLTSNEELRNEPPTVAASFLIENKTVSDDQFYSELALRFEPSSDIQFDNTLLHVDGVLKAGERREVAVKFRVLGIVGARLTVNGRVTWENNLPTDGSSASEGSNAEIPFAFEIPVATFMLHIPTITPAQFTAFLYKSENFPFSGSTSVNLTASSSSVEQEFDNAIAQITTVATGTHVVEKVPGAVSIYGRSVQGYQVAGLTKLAITREESEDTGEVKANLKIELKCTDQAFIDGLVREIERLFALPS